MFVRTDVPEPVSPRKVTLPSPREMRVQFHSAADPSADPAADPAADAAAATTAQPAPAPPQPDGRMVIRIRVE
jgi:hypothetical protein